MPGIGERARSTPDAPALIEIAGTTTFAELDARQSALGGALRAAGLKPKDRIAVLSANRKELIEVTTGALRMGIVPVPIHNALGPAEAGYILEDSGARWLFADRVFEHAGIERVVTFGDAYERLLHDAKPITLADHVLGRPMHYTSGTTGKPKGVWAPPTGDRTASSVSERFRRMWGLAAGDVHLLCSPLTHSAPHRFVIRTLEAGGAVALQKKFEAAETLAAIELFGVTTTFMVPTHLERIFSLEPKARRRHDLSSMRLLAHAGAPIREETKRATIDLFPPESVWEFYGSTEGQATRISTQEWLRKPGSVGQAIEGAEVIVRDEGGREVEAGEVGEVWIDVGEGERFEYWRDRRKTAAAWDGSAFTVGDLGWLDEQGYLFLSGRKHDMIITGGINVYPQEVEAELSQHPAVAEVIVYGEPHDEWGQELRARVVPAFGQPLDPDSLRAWLRERLAGYKCPRVIELVDELPRTATGKLMRTPVVEDE